MIKVINLKKSFNGQKVLRGVNLEIPLGKTTAIIGRSGQGKTILLRLLVGLIKPDSGKILIDGIDFTQLKGDALNTIKRKFSMLFQGGALFDSFTVYDNIAFPLRELTYYNEDTVRNEVLKALRDVGLEGMGNKYPDELSGGMKKRVGLARAIITGPEFMFFDEPTTGLDPITENAIHLLIKNCMKNFSCTEILVSHNLKEVLTLADKVAMLHDGVIIEQTTPKKLMESKNRFVHQFFEGVINGPILQKSVKEDE